jgi:hypothetical protein
MNYHKWKRDEVSLSKLKLDPENPRLGTSIERPTQEELIAELFRLGKVYELAKDIARQGFMPTEVLVAIRNGVSLLVIEGNERLAALKVLSNPELAPAPYQKRVKALVEGMKYPLPSKVQVTIAPSREETIPLVNEKHNGKTIDAWTRVMQARYIASVIDEGITVDDAVDVYGLDRADVLRCLWESRLYDVIRSLDLPPLAAQTVRDPRAFPWTTLTRLFETPSVQTSLGAELDETHGFVVYGSQDQFKDRLSSIVTDIVEEKVNSRTVNKAEDITAYLKGKFEKAPSRSSKSQGEGVPALSFVDPARVQQQPPVKSKKKKKRQLRESPSIVPRGFVCNVDDTRIQDIVTELRRLRLEEFRNAVSVLLRSLLDMSVTKYSNDSGELTKIIAKDKLKNPNRKPDWIPTLNQQLSHLLDEASVPLSAEGRKSLKKFLSDTQSSLTLESLNWFTHIRYVPPTVEQLRSFWVMLTPLLDLTLKTP